MPRAKVKYTPEIQAQFVARVIANGGNVEGTAAIMGIPKASAKRIWANNPVGHAVQKIHKERFGKESWEVIYKVLRQLKRRLGSLEADKIRAYTQLIATLYEKQSHAALEPTTRAENVSTEYRREEKVERSEHTTRILQDYHDGKAPKMTQAQRNEQSAQQALAGQTEDIDSSVDGADAEQHTAEQKLVIEISKNESTQAEQENHDVIDVEALTEDDESAQQDDDLGAIRAEEAHEEEADDDDLLGATHKRARRKNAKPITDHTLKRSTRTKRRSRRTR